MDVLIYLLVICLIIYLVLSLLPIILPFILILIVAFSIMGWFAKRKIRKHMEAFEDDFNQQSDDRYTFDSHTSGSQDDVIDVEFTEREDNGE